VSGATDALRGARVAEMDDVSPGAWLVRCGLAHTCAALEDETARCWGRNANGQLGDGTTTSRSTPVMVLAP